MSRIMRNLEERLFLSNNNSSQCEEHVHERGHPKSLLGFKVLLPCTIERLRQTRLKAWPYLLELTPTLNKRRIWDKKVISATKSHGSWCHGPVIIKIKRRSVSLIPQITVSWLKQLFVVSNFQINTTIWGVKNLISDLVLIWVNMVRWLMTDQFSSMPFQSKGLTHVLTSKKNYFQHWHMSVNPKNLHVDFVLPNFNLCLFENEADEEAELLS